MAIVFSILRGLNLTPNNKHALIANMAKKHGMKKKRNS